MYTKYLFKIIKILKSQRALQVNILRLRDSTDEKSIGIYSYE